MKLSVLLAAVGIVMVGYSAAMMTETIYESDYDSSLNENKVQKEDSDHLMDSVQDDYDHESAPDDDPESVPDSQSVEKENGDNSLEVKFFRFQPNYELMNHPKKTIKFPGAHGVCSGPYGRIIAVSWGTGKAVMYNNAGHTIKELQLPRGSSKYLSDCVYNFKGIFVADNGAKKIYKYSVSGSFQSVFVKGSRNFVRIAQRNNRLYVTQQWGGNSHAIYVYNLKGKLVKYIFATKGSKLRGLAFDSANNLHAAVWGRCEEVYTRSGKQVMKRDFCHGLNIADGMDIDAADNVLIADRDVSSGSEIFVYSKGGCLIKRMKGFSQAIDVAVSKHSLWVADQGKGCVYKY